MERESSSSTGGIGFAGALVLVLLVLKLTHVIDWSWWWVTAPLWMSFVVFILIIIGFFALKWYIRRKY